MQLAFKTHLVLISIALAAVADPAAAFALNQKLPNGDNLAISVPAQTSRTSQGLASAVKAAIPSTVMCYVNATTATTIDIIAVGGELPAAANGNVTVSSKDSVTHTSAMIAGALGGFIIGR